MAATELRAKRLVCILIWTHILRKQLNLVLPQASKYNNSLALSKPGSDLPPSVGRSGNALGNGSTIDAKVLWCPAVYRIKSDER